MTRIDSRVARRPGSIVTIDGTDYTIGKECFRGGTALCYSASRDEKNEHYVIKEIYPPVGAQRNNDGDVYPTLGNSYELCLQSFQNEIILTDRTSSKTYQCAWHYECFDLSRGIGVIRKNSEDTERLDQAVAKYVADNHTPMERLEWALRIVKSLLTGLHKIHTNARLLHLDLSLTNIFLSQDGNGPNAFFLDFGEARQLDDLNMCPADSGSTSLFGAPERFSRATKTLSPAADTFSAAVLFYHILTSGSWAYHNQPIPEAMILAKPSCAEAEYGLRCMDLPDGTEKAVFRFLKKGMTFRPDRRYQTVAEMLEQIDRLLRIVSKKGIDRYVLLQNSIDRLKKEIAFQKYLLALFPKMDLTIGRLTMITGDGGAGKSTFLKRLWRHGIDKALQNDNVPIPLYVQLQHFDSDSDKKDNFILSQILDVYAGHWYAEKNPVHDDPIQRLKNEFKKGPYLLLLDGLNEAANTDLLNKEIGKLSNTDEYPGLSICIASRNKPEWGSWDTFQIRTMPPLEETVIQNQLTQTGHPPATGKLLETLQNPFYLSLFLNIEENTEASQTPGEILLANHNRLLSEHKNARHGQKYTEFRKFVLDYLLPIYAESCDTLSFPYEKAKVYILNAFDAVGETGFESASELADNIFSNWSVVDRKSKEVILDVKAVLNELTEVAYLRKEGNRYIFTHQNYLEFYQALSIKKQMETAQNEIPHVLGAESIAVPVMSYLGDIIGEYAYERKVQLPVNSPIETWMQEHLTFRSDIEAKLAVKNLVDCMKISRNNNIPGNYNNLDLSFTNFYNSKLAASSFFGSVLCKKTFISDGHQRIVECMVFAPVKGLLLTCEHDKLFCWETKTGQLRYSFAVERYLPIRSLDISPNEKYILVSFYNRNSLMVLNMDDGEHISSYRLPWSWEDRHSEYRYMLGIVSPDGFFSIAAFLPDSRHILIGSSDGVLWHIDAETGKQSRNPQKIVMPIVPDNQEDNYWESYFSSNYYCISHDRRKMIVMHRNRVIEMWDTMSLTCNNNVSDVLQKLTGSRHAIFSLDDRYIIRHSKGSISSVYDLVKKEIMTETDWSNNFAYDVTLGYSKGISVDPRTMKGTYYYVDPNLYVHFLDAEEMSERNILMVGNRQHGREFIGHYTCGASNIEAIRISWSGQLQVLDTKIKQVASLYTLNNSEQNAKCGYGIDYIYLNILSNHTCKLWVKNSEKYVEKPLHNINGQILYVDTSKNTVMIKINNGISVLSLDDPLNIKFRCEGVGKWLEKIEIRYEHGHKLVVVNGKEYKKQVFFSPREMRAISKMNSQNQNWFCSEYCIIPELNTVVACNAEGFLRTWNIQTNECTFEQKIGIGQKTIHRIPGTNYILIHTNTVNMSLWDIEHHKRIARWQESSDSLRAREDLWDIASILQLLDTELRWDDKEKRLSVFESLAVLFYRPNAYRHTSTIRISGDKKRIAIWFKQANNIRVWRGGNKFKIIQHHFSKICDYCFDWDGSDLYVQGDNGALYCYDVNSDQISVDISNDKTYNKLNFLWGNVDACDISGCRFDASICNDENLKKLILMNGGIIDLTQGQR